MFFTTVLMFAVVFVVVITFVYVLLCRAVVAFVVVRKRIDRQTSCPSAVGGRKLDKKQENIESKDIKHGRLSYGRLLRYSTSY